LENASYHFFFSFSKLADHVANVHSGMFFPAKNNNGETTLWLPFDLKYVS
jgi:hypothetical protein